MRFPIFIPIHHGSGSTTSIPADATLIDLIVVLMQIGFVVVLTMVILTPFAVAFLKFMDIVTDKFM